MFTPDDTLAARFEFWTADGLLWTHHGTSIPCESAWWYGDEREFAEFIDLGGEA